MTDTDRADAANKKLKHAKFRLIDARDKINNSIEDIIDIECASLTQKPTDTDRADALDWLEAGRDKIYTKDELDIIYPTIRASLTQKDASVLIEALEFIAGERQHWDNLMGNVDIAKQSLQDWREGT